MRRIVLIGLAVLLLATPAWGQGKKGDCKALSKSLDDVSSAAASQVGAMWATAVMAQGLPLVVVQSISNRVQDTVTLASSGLDGGEIVRQTLRLLEAKKAVLSAAGCGAPKKAAAQSPMPCETDGTLRPRIGMTAARMHECFPSLVLASEMQIGDDLEQTWQTENRRGYIRIRNGVIVDWGAY